MREIGLDEVINQVKRELLTPNPAAKANDPYPLFMIDKIELEIATRISVSADGSIKFSVIGGAEAGVGVSRSEERSHVVRVSLSPVLTREELVAEVLKDEKVRQMVSVDSQHAFVRHDNSLGGEAE
ncbi:hypothetical protein EKD04_006185 [Chloroflexales bacterium ZM16-3]|nr:hypothetical protein [Chloroflexales bacterium ZM16-3]